MSVMKKAVKKAFDLVGLQLLRKTPSNKDNRRPTRTSLAGALKQISSVGFRPETVIDVGVAHGTHELYEEFGDTNLLLIEPLKEFEPRLKKICRIYNAQYVLAAAGEVSGTATLNVHLEQLDCSSVFKEVEGIAVDGIPRDVPIVAIDDVCSQKHLRGPFLIKIDVQGAELRALSGAAKTLRETEVVILEVTFFGTMIGGPQFSDVVAKMKQWGFVAYDVWGLNYRPFDHALAQVDMAFVREDGLFRQSHVFATPEQRRRMTATFGVEQP
jgi:FkbM family methyltransferase